MNHALSRVSSILTSAALSAVLVAAWPVAAQAADKAPAKASAQRAVGKAESTLVAVDGAWIRATVKGQSGTGGFMNLTASQALTLIGFSSSVAGSSELHDMTMDGGVMRMRAIESLELPAGKTVSLRPGMGGQHLMLMDLRQQLKEGEEVSLTLKLRAADGKVLTQEVKVPVKGGSMTMAPAQGACPMQSSASAPNCAGQGGQGGGHHHHGHMMQGGGQ
jgi:copper(I)-binding protein